MTSLITKTFNFSGRAGDLLRLFQDEPFLFCLESGILNKAAGRYSFIGFDPYDIFKSNSNTSLLSLRAKFLKDFVPFHKSVATTPTPLESGLVGFLSYDFGLQAENIPCSSENDLGTPDCFFGFYDCILTVDHFKKKLIVTSSGFPERNESLRLSRAKSRLENILKRINKFETSGYPKVDKSLSFPHALGGNPDEVSTGCPISSRRLIRFGGKTFGHDNPEIKSNFTKPQYLNAIKTILDHIRAGDVYQVNLSQRFELSAPKNVDYLRLYQALNQVSSVNFGGYFNAGTFQVICNSPERFIQLKDRVVTVTPMKGTRPRGESVLDDRQNRKDLLESQKDKAELLMITDLYRNDLGKVCGYGSVKVKRLRRIETYSTVFQSTSTVQGILKKDQDAFDVLQSCFPGGSVTGCPKIMAMKIISKLEPSRRGIYTGALGYISSNGQMDFNIMIRTLLGTKSKMYFQSGGGIVADSDPEQEYEETLVKTKALRLCLDRMFSRLNRK